MQIPELWTKYLSEVQEIFPQAVIAGGCLRDLYCGLDISNVKDVDIFLPNPSDADIAKLSERYAGQLKRDLKGSYGNLCNSDIAGILTICSHRGPDIEVIGLNLPVEQIPGRFDIGICQIWYDGKDIHTTEAFKSDVENKTFTLLRSDNYEQFARSRSRCEKFITGKFAGYTFNDNGFSEKLGLVAQLSPTTFPFLRR
jgi:hypothetical protein